MRKLFYLLQETLWGIRRGGWLNWAAISSITVSLFLFGLSLQTTWQLDTLLNHLGSGLEITVYLQPQAQGEKFLPLIQNFPQVEAVSLISKEEAWVDLLQELGVSDLEEATQQLEGNPLVDELQVKVNRPESIVTVVKQLQAFPEVDECIYGNRAGERFAQIRRSLSWIGVIVVVFVSLSAIAVVTTTLHLIAVARRSELEIMQLVGATSTWIFLPFLLQGTLFGLIGSIFSLVLMTGLRAIASHFILAQQDFLQIVGDSLQLNFVQMGLLILIVISFGVSIGLTGSFLALRRR